jgi:hypothetical protein
MPSNLDAADAVVFGGMGGISSDSAILAKQLIQGVNLSLMG